MTHDFAFSGLIVCAKCGCTVVGEIKKQRYVYYHCTGYADKCRSNPASFRRRYVREEVLERQFALLLGRLQFDDEVLSWVREALHVSHADKRREQEEAITWLRSDVAVEKPIRIGSKALERITSRLHGMFQTEFVAVWRTIKNLRTLVIGTIYSRDAYDRHATRLTKIQIG
jgi:hypothetical protein